MKKRLILFISLLLAMSTFSTVFAATASNFNDVPSDHWSYPAIQELVKAGILDGYSDQTFRGDKPMTRYEMAEVVRKAIENSNKATAIQKTLIDKLGVEYALELNKIDTRVKKIENFTKSTLKVGFDTLMYFGMDNPPAGQPKAEGNEKFGWRPRLIFSGDLNDQTKFYMRIGTQLGNPGIEVTPKN